MFYETPARIETTHAGRGGEESVAAIELENLTKVYPDGTHAVTGLQLEIGDGEFVVFVGPSGCGKTSALRMIAGLEEITAGVVRVGGRVVNDLSPKERDMAMVFQNYALYPHMNARDNMAFGLKMRGLGRDEIERRVAEAARILGLEDLLGKKPRTLSGGQRQRVAMGRAIVREPQAFLMDEPLSNLDAKLRVQMRAEIARIQRALGVTTVYVTHDQSEAITLGDRVCVLRDGVLQQVASPQQLYDRPANLFVAGFIGSPAMNLVEAGLAGQDGGLVASFGPHRLTLGPAVLNTRPALRDYVGRKVALGIRPEDMEDAALVGGGRDGGRLRIKVDIREDMGSEVYLHFGIDAPPVKNEAVAAAATIEPDEEIVELAAAPANPFVARVERTSRAREGDTVELAIVADRLHVFDLETGLGIYHRLRERAPATS
jgi:multiple sugar transport system ATP-binding protein